MRTRPSPLAPVLLFLGEQRSLGLEPAALQQKKGGCRRFVAPCMSEGCGHQLSLNQHENAAALRFHSECSLHKTKSLRFNRTDDNPASGVSCMPLHQGGELLRLFDRDVVVDCPEQNRTPVRPRKPFPNNLGHRFRGDGITQPIAREFQPALMPKVEAVGPVRTVCAGVRLLERNHWNGHIGTS